MNREFSVQNSHHYAVEDLESLYTPRPLLFYDQIIANRQTLIAEAGGPESLRLMAKTVKSPDILKLYTDVGVSRFKASSLREAELSVIPAGAKDILISYPLLGPYVEDYFKLAAKFPDVRLSALISNKECATALSNGAKKQKRETTVYLDVNPHMHRTGVSVGGPLEDLAQFTQSLPGIRIAGLHAYDGHTHHDNPYVLRLYAEKFIALLDRCVTRLRAQGIEIDEVVTSSTLTFASAAEAYRNANPKPNWSHNVSPGTCVLWDTKYNDIQPGHFSYAMAVATRIIDIVDRDGAPLLTTDAGVKMGISPDSGATHVTTLNGYAPFGGSERHGTFVWLGRNRATWSPLDDSIQRKVGDIALLFPPHVCTTLNQYDYGHMIRNGRIAERIEIVGRDG